MNFIKDEIYFIQFLLHVKNHKQIDSLLKNVTDKQYGIVRDIASKILKEKITLSSYQYKQLLPHKNFIRRLGVQTTRTPLFKNIQIVKKLLQIGLMNYEQSKKISSCTIRNMGKIKRKRYECKTSDSESSSSDSIGSFSTDDSEGRGSDCSESSEEETGEIGNQQQQEKEQKEDKEILEEN